jgi:hypothetical protein
MKVRHNLEVKRRRKSASDGLSNLKTTHHKFAITAASNAGMNETEPLLIRELHGQGPTGAADIPEVERGVQPLGDFRLFCSLLVDSIPGLSFPRLERYPNLTEDFYSDFVIYVAKFYSGCLNSYCCPTRSK